MKNAKELVASYMQEVWVNRKVNEVKKFISAETFIQHNPHLANGLEALEGFLPHLFNNLMPNGTWEVKRIVAENDLVVVHSLAKPMPEALGMAVVDIFRVKDNLIVEHWDVSADVPATTVSGNEIV
jgi:predicted SnoaL-like aldol condensation-catalyzing enzyme